ncbi:MAG TPA: hypothetical protein VE053_02455 [Allosphingosinicella sp.]|nr:hypothetical protein [Allosphingosinicella sp.]
MWSHFRAVAARIGLSLEEVEAVERGGVPTLVQDPLNSQIRYHVRPDPDWTERLGEAWEGTLVNSRRESAGILPIPDGRMRIAQVSSPERGVTALVVPGEYEVTLTIAHEGSEETYDYAEYVSHAFALLRGREDVALIEPMTAEDGTELAVDATSTAFAGEGVLERIAASYPGGWIKTMYDLIRSAAPEAEVSDRKSARAVTDDGSGALIVVNAGRDREDYPLFRIADPDGNTIGVLIDYFVDNRPH